MKLYNFQNNELEATKDKNKVAYYLDMGLGKTFVGSEKLIRLGAKVNLVICQKSKIDDWIEHFENNYKEKVLVKNLTNKKEFDEFISFTEMADEFDFYQLGVINYELAFRRKQLLYLEDFTLMLDESSLIQNETAKRSKFIMKLNYKNLILLSGTPTSGKYERLWSQLHMLGWKISKDLFWRQYVDTEIIDNQGFPLKVVRGYKNVDRLKSKMRDYGCRFLKTDEVFDLPDQVFNEIKVNITSEYRTFKRDRIVDVTTNKSIGVNVEYSTYECMDSDGMIRPHTFEAHREEIYTKTLVGDTTLTKMLYERQLCGSYNANKLEALKDLLESSDDRIIIFYNFNNELDSIKELCEELNRPVSEVNGQVKDLTNWNEQNNTVLLGQYQAASMGLNLQQANKIIYFTPPLSSELFEQSKKRISRIGQTRNCFYYLLICKNSIEEKIYKTLEERRDFTDELFRELEKD